MLLPIFPFARLSALTSNRAKRSDNFYNFLPSNKISNPKLELSINCLLADRSSNFDKALACPLHAVPTAHEDGTTNVFVQQEGRPHAANAPTQRDAEEITQANCHTPLHNQPHVERIVDIARRAQGGSGEDVDGAAHFEQNVNEQNEDTQVYDFGVGGEPAQNAVSAQGYNGGKEDGDAHRTFHDVLAHEEGRAGFSFANQMADADGSALRHGDAEQVAEHDDVDTIRTRGKRLDTQHVDEISDNHLREVIRQLFAGGRETYPHQILQFHTGEGTEIGQRETRDVLAEQNNEKQHHGHAAAEGSRNGRTLHAQSPTIDHIDYPSSSFSNENIWAWRMKEA